MSVSVSSSSSPIVVMTAAAASLRQHLSRPHSHSSLVSSLGRRRRCLLTTLSFLPFTSHSSPPLFPAFLARPRRLLSTPTFSSPPSHHVLHPLQQEEEPSDVVVSSYDEDEDEDVDEEGDEDSEEGSPEPDFQTRGITRSTSPPPPLPLPSYPSPKLSVKEKKELAAYAHSLGKKLKCQQVGKSGVTPSVAASFIENLEANELLKIKVHGSCPGELTEVINQLEEATGSVAVGQIGRAVILYRPSLSKMKKKDTQSARKSWKIKPEGSAYAPKMQKKWPVQRFSGRHSSSSSSRV